LPTLGGHKSTKGKTGRQMTRQNKKICPKNIHCTP